MEGKKSIGFGLRGTLLIISLFLGFMLYMAFTNYPLNILADFYGGAQRVSTVLTVATLIGTALQIILSNYVGKIKSLKKITAVIGLIAIIMSFMVVFVPFSMLGLWTAAYFVQTITSTMYCLFFLGIIAGQWFPRRKGTVMGIATIAYPFTNGMIGFFAGTAMAPLAEGQPPALGRAYMPFLIAVVVGYLIYVFFITDYPEQCGAYRDNDKSMTMEIAQKMMEQEIENKRTTVWTTGNIFKNRDFWCAALTCGLILTAACGAMSQSAAIVGFFPELNYTIIMMMVALFGAIGSYLLGVLDTRFGTKKSMIIATILMIVSGILGMAAVMTGIGGLTVASLILIAMFMGASSNYTVSVAAQYWRREDFGGVFACVNPVANILNAFGPMIVAFLLFGRGGLSLNAVYIFIIICGIVGTIMMVIFSRDHVKATDDRLRSAAGKPLDDELANRQ